MNHRLYRVVNNLYVRGIINRQQFEDIERACIEDKNQFIKEELCELVIEMCNIVFNEEENTKAVVEGMTKAIKIIKSFEK